jgi:SAM-dependent methyltransferase
MNERGCWTLKSETDTHVIDESLCDAIITVCENYGIKSIADIGCGNGSYTRRFLNAGFYCDGFDGSPLTEELTNAICRTMDFSAKQEIGQYGLVLSLEVGEHIPKEYEQVFLDNLVRAASETIILSWAVVGQGGDGHVNCQDNDYIIQQMNDRGFSFDPVTTEYLRDKAKISWFKNTILTFEK